ncbi:tetratricopeptide repeat protein 17 isoform X2 [Protopterus annectens]|uniref:tetratricopeptide repeat protein 17 isoform X2 n=1 Tax=Protopterus annectens TaxID=7888 RepID=UPI001CFC2A0B|nr:tetratricopeptide repeat protein 17 isoform X2 [Protopterus annectens]
MASYRSDKLELLQFSGVCCWRRLLNVVVILSVFCRSRATTHWIVTEDGKIQQQVDSPVNLKHPHDLVIFMRQETTVNYLKELEKQLVAQKIHIEENEDRDTGLEQRHYKEDPDCIKAKVPLGDLDLYDGTYISMESKDLSPEDYIGSKSLPPDLKKPDCTEILELPYSIHAFQHLRGIQERTNLTAPLLSKEDPIFSSFPKNLGRNPDEVGHRIHEALLRNTSSWVLYNLASFYWRIKNEPYHVVECAVRALHFSPRQHKDLALMNLANVLHRAHFSADAAILVHAALDVSTDLLTSHYTLGNIYAMLGEYNHSVLCYDHALKAKPGFEQAVKRKHAVLCQQKLEQKLEAQHRSLQRTLNELKEYQKQHDHYLRQQDILEKYKLIQEEQILRNIIHETQMAKEAQLGNHQICQLGSQHQSLHCQWDLPVRYHRGEIFENVDNVQFGDDTSTATIVSVSSDLHVNWNETQDGLQFSPVTRSVYKVWGRDANSFRDSQDMLWPKRGDCAKSYPSLPTSDELPTYFLSPENRGLKIQSILDKNGNFTTGQVPNCLSVPDFGNNESLHHITAELERRLALETVLPDDHAKQILFSRIASWAVTEEHIGELLTRAIEQPLTFLSLGNAYLALNNISGALQIFQQALGLKRKCPECESSLKLIRCLQFYPLLYNISSLSSSVCEGDYCHGMDEELSQEHYKYFGEFEETTTSRDGEGSHDSESLASHVILSKGAASMGHQSTSVAKINFSEGQEKLEESQMTEEMMALVDEFENSWPLDTFEGALEVKGRRVDLQGIRVLRKGSKEGLAGSCYGDCEDDDEAEWITFQVKRMKKTKTEGSDPQEITERNINISEESGGRLQSTPEISGPKVPAPGPQGKRRDYVSLGWPSPDECLKLRRVELSTVASTWLAVSAKNIDVTEHIDFATPLQEPAVEPLCNPNLPASMHTLDHLQGVSNRASIHYTGESQLKEVLQSLAKDKYPPQSFEQVGTRIAKVLEKNQTSWVLSSMAALYWRVKGQGKKAIDCLRQALHYAPYQMKDVPLISLANIFHNAKLWDNALTVAKMAVQIAPHFVVNHFTLANVYLAMEEFEKAMQWYESTLKLQPEFVPAKDRLRTIQCHLLMKKKRRYP